MAEEELSLRDKIRNIIEARPEYKDDAYFFVLEALDFTMKKHKREGHVSGEELLGGIKELALSKFGPMTRSVLEFWGIRKTHDFGQFVFALVDSGLLGRQPEDSLSDFANVYDFEEVFDQPFRC